MTTPPGNPPVDVPSVAPVPRPAPRSIRLAWWRSPWGVLQLATWGLALTILLSLLAMAQLGEPGGAVVVVIFLVFTLLGSLLLFWLGAVIDAVAVPGWLWREAHRSQGLFVIVVMVPLLGGLAYLLAARPALRRAAQLEAAAAPTA